MTEDDAEENAESNGKLHNASSLRCLMALRHVLYSDATNSGWVTNGHRRRIVVQTSTIAEYFGDIFYAPDDSQVFATRAAALIYPAALAVSWCAL